MPAAVAPADLEEEDLYKPIDESTRLRSLADIIDVGPWLISVGDVLLNAPVIINLLGWFLQGP